VQNPASPTFLKGKYDNLMCNALLAGLVLSFGLSAAGVVDMRTGANKLE
jgi:hypothetical protein